MASSSNYTYFTFARVRLQDGVRGGWCAVHAAHHHHPLPLAGFPGGQAGAGGSGGVVQDQGIASWPCQVKEGKEGWGQVGLGLTV